MAGRPSILPLADPSLTASSSHQSSPISASLRYFSTSESLLGIYFSTSESLLGIYFSTSESLLGIYFSTSESAIFLVSMLISASLRCSESLLGIAHLGITHTLILRI
jgi:hypothetical protein